MTTIKRLNYRHAGAGMIGAPSGCYPTVLTWLSIIGWLGALAALIVALQIPPQSWLFGIAAMIYFGGFLAIPFMPLAGMPLVVH